MNAEAPRINQRLTTLTGAHQETANNEAALPAISLILFWPAACSISGGTDNAAEIASLRGQAEGLASAASQRQCS